MTKLSQATVDAIAVAVAAALDAREAKVATGAPASAKALSPEQGTFLTFVHERAASKVACGIHGAKVCNRTFMPTSAGLSNHVARIV